MPMTRNPNMREAILSAAELLFSTHGFNAVSIRDIALEAGANPGSITYHFKSKDGLLLEIYKRHCGPMNKRRIELLVAARRVRDVQDRLEAIVRAYVQPAFSSSSDLAGGGARFTRLRAVMSAEGNAVVGRIIAEIFDDTTSAFIEAIGESLPHLPRTTIVWRSSSCSARSIIRSSARSGSRGCRAAKPMAPIWRKRSSNSSRRRSPRCRRPT